MELLVISNILCHFLLFNKFVTIYALKKINGVGVPYVQVNYQLPPDEWFDQKLDHFTPSDMRTWKQRYGTNSTFYSEGGPVFLMIGGEGEANPKWLVQGQWIESAAQYRALCFQLEHRFYGKSHPTHDTSTENLIYLSSQQALADIAYFITGMNQKYKLSPNTKWITFGGSYPGSLSAWARIKYPYLIHGAISSSGPLLSKLDFYEYYQTVKNDLSRCADEIVSANAQLDTLLKSKSGRHYIKKNFLLCDSINVEEPNDISNLFENLADGIASVVQYNKDNRESTTRNITIDTICDIMTSQKKSVIERYAELIRFFLKISEETCLDFKYYKMVNFYQQTSWNSLANGGSRQWLYQTCTEFGFFQTSSNQTDLFGSRIPVEFYVQMCEDVFGEKFNGDVISNEIQRTNILTGDISVNPTNVVFVYGTVDPWHTLGIPKGTEADKNYYAYWMEGAAHCADMYPSFAGDIPTVVTIRQKISSIIASWLNPSTTDVNHRQRNNDEIPYSFRIVYSYFPKKIFTGDTVEKSLLVDI